MFCLSALTWKYKAVGQMGWEKMAHENEALNRATGLTHCSHCYWAQTLQLELRAEPALHAGYGTMVPITSKNYM